MSKKIEYFIKFLIGLTFVVPWIVIPSSYIFPFIVPKILLFRSLVLLMLGGYILLLTSNWLKYKIKLIPINIGVSLFFISFAISTFVGVDWYKSFWDCHERMLGLFTIFHYIVYYFVVTSVLKDWKEWKWYLRLFLGAGFVVMFIGFLQKFYNPELLLNRGGDRVSATLGNSIYYSGYGLFLFFIGLLLALKEKNKKGFWFWYAVIGSFFGFLGVFLGGTRGALLGLMAGLFVLCVSYLIIIKDHKNVRKIIAGLMILGVLIGSLCFAFRKTDFVKNIPGVGRLVNASLFEGTGNTRLMAWEIALKAWQEKPIFGWGPNNYYYAFNKYYNPKFLEYGWGETWFDNAHSVIMNTLTVQGIFGIFTYLSMFGFTIFVLIKKRKAGQLDNHILAISLAFLVAHLVAKSLVFDDPTSYLFFFFFLAFINQSTELKVQVQNSQIKNNKKIINKDISIGLIIITGMVILLLIRSTNLLPGKANKATVDTLRSFELGSVTTTIEFYEKAKSYPSPHIDDIRSDFARTASSLVANIISNNQNKIPEIQELLNFTSSELKNNISLHPRDVRVYISLAQIVLNQFNITKDLNYLIEAENLLTEALVHSPKRQQIQYMLSSVKLNLGKIDEAINILQNSIENDSKISEGWWRLALLNYQIGKIDEAKKIVQQAKDLRLKFDEQGINIINGILSAD